MLTKEMLTSTKKNWKVVNSRTRIIHKLTASCLQLSFHLTFKFLVLQTDRQFFLFFFFCYILNVKQQFKVDTPMQIIPFWSPKILPLNLVFLEAFGHFNKLIVLDSRQQFTQHCSNVHREKINFDQFYRSAMFPLLWNH